MVQDALDVALLVAAAIEAVGGEYFVGGSVASSLQGEPRAEKQWRDVVEVLRIRGPELDAAYLDAWSLRLGVAGLLTRARAGA
jgi:hypothetical protein